jgi:hypothetical protein
MALFFSSTGAGLHILAPPSTYKPGPPFTFAGWIYATFSSSGIVVSTSSNSLLNGIDIRDTTGSKFILASLAVGNVGTSSAGYTPNTWTHIACSQDGSGNWAWFIQGAASGSGTSGTIIASQVIQLGQQDNVASSSNWTGNMADCAFWNVILTASEIAGLARGVRPGQVRPKSLTAWWGMQGDNLSTEPDLSLNGNNGTLTSLTLATTAPPITFFTPRWPQWLIPPVPPAPTFILMPQIVT